MPMSMVGIGLVLLVSGATGSYGTAGAVTATFSVAQAVCGPRIARLVDRLGQHRVVPWAVAAHAVALSALLVCTTADAPRWTFFPAAAVAGAGFVSIGGLVRARWAHVLRPPARLETAYSFESVLDECIFVVGPPLVAVLATGVDPLAGLVLALVLFCVGGLALQAQRASEPPPRPAEASAGSAIRVPGLAALVVVFVALGVVFGGFDVAAIAFADHAGHRGLAGAAIAAYAGGSMVAAIAYGSRPWRAPLERRLLAALTTMTLTFLLTLALGSLGALFVVAFVSGLSVAPCLISGFALVESLVPRARLTEGLAWTTTGIGLGVSLGALLSGRVVDAVGAQHAFLVPLLAAAAGVVAAVAGIARRPPGSVAACGS